jgi:hypothetical protein
VVTSGGDNVDPAEVGGGTAATGLVSTVAVIGHEDAV